MATINKTDRKPKNCRLLLIDEKNIAICAQLFLDVFQHEPWNYAWLTKENVNRYFDDLIHTPKFQGFVYEKDNKIVGACFGVVNDYFSQIIYDIKEIYVHYELQNKGIGSKMLREIETVLLAQDVNLVTLFTQKHISAFPFYIKNGYSVADETVYLCKRL